jgi:hypothetical protein
MLRTAAPSNAARRSLTPAIGDSSSSKAAAEREANVSRNASGNARANRVATAAESVTRFVPKPSVMASSSVVEKSTAVRHSARTRAKVSSLSTRTPSQSKIVRPGTRSLSLQSRSLRRI